MNSKFLDYKNTIHLSPVISNWLELTIESDYTLDMSSINISLGSSPFISVTSKLSPKSQNAEPNTP